MASGWIEKQTRIPFAGIIAMVLIVAVVAVSLRLGLDTFWGEPAEIEVQAASDSNLRGSASFGGERELQLLYKERLEGLLTMKGSSTGFLVDVPARLLTLSVDGRQEEVVLSPTEDGTGLRAAFEHDARQVSVVIYPAERQLFWRPAGGYAIEAALTDVFTYEGSFMFSAQKYAFSFRPALSDALIAGRGDSWTVPLTRAGTMYSGTWHDGSGHPVTVETDSLSATVGELW